MRATIINMFFLHENSHFLFKIILKIHTNTYTNRESFQIFLGVNYPTASVYLKYLCFI